MTGGFRISESGDSRVSELGDSRITEELNFASVSLSTSRGAYRVDELNNQRTDEQGNTRVSEDFDQVLFTVSPDLYLSASVSLVSDGSTLTAGEVRQLIYAELSSAGSISGSVNAEYSVSNSYIATGSIVSDPDLTVDASVSLSASGTLVNDGYDFVHGGLFTAEPQDEYVRITEAGDTRITEESDVRIVSDVLPNAAIGIFSASYTYIAFESTAYIKYNGEWTRFTPKVKQDGTWDDPLAIYKKIDDENWKRAY